jgi:predicted ATPase
LWRGEALAGLDDCPFARSRGARLEAARFEVLVERLGTDLDRGLHASLIPELEALAAEHPAHEGVYRLLIIALYRAGRQVDALSAHERLRKHLAGQFGLDLSPPLKELALEVLRQEPRLDWQARAADTEPAASVLPEPARHRRIRGALPHPVTSLVGRKAELAEVLALLERHRLVTIAGSGGCGKTRLAIAAGHQLAADGEVRFVRLEGLTDGDLLAEAVAEALGVRLGHANPAPAELADGLADRNVLIFLDNCEHVLADCADLVMTVLESAPAVRFLLTSREQLSVPGEAVQRLRPLAAPGPDEPEEVMAASEAVQLFIERAAAAAGSAGQFGPAALPAVAEVCRQLDGIPLAIEIAAVRLATLSLDQLSRRLADRFAVLRGESRAAVPRHRTLLAAMAWSYDLLDEQERALFGRLAVFASAFPLEAAEAVCADGMLAQADVCDLLARLAAKSLIVVEQAEGEVEYRLLNTVREYANSRLQDPAERRELARRHHGWCLDQVTGAAAALRFGDQPWWARRMRACMDDVRTALDWALGPQGHTVALAAELWPIWEMQGQEREGRQWINRALHRGEAASPLQRAGLLLGAAVLARASDEFGESHQLLRRASCLYKELGHADGSARCRLELGRLLVVEGKLALAEDCAADARQQYAALADEWGVAWANMLAGNVLMVRGEYDEAARLLQAALATGRRFDNPAIIGDAVAFLGLVATRSGRVSEASGHFAEALRLGRLLGNDSLVNVALANLGVVAGRDGDYARALTLLDEALAMARQRGEPLAIARILLESGEIEARQGQCHRSEALAAEALRLYCRIGAPSPVAQCLDLLARTSLALGHHARAAMLSGAADGVRRDLGLAPPEPVRPAELHNAGQEVASAWQRGIRLSVAEAIRAALNEASE